MKILSMSGFIPEHICDTVRFVQYSGRSRVSHYCGYASDFIAQVMEDDGIDGAVFPKSCDSSRGIGSYCGASGKFLYQLAVPSRRDAAAIRYFAHSIEEYKVSVERYYGIEITDGMMEERGTWIQRRNRQLKECYNCLDSIDYGSYLDGIHAMLQQPLMEQEAPKLRQNARHEGKRVYLVGSFLSNSGLAYSIERFGMKIVGDNLTESKRLFSQQLAGGRDSIFENIAESILGNKLSPTQNEFKEILAGDLQEIREKNVRGVIFLTQKYCEPYDYLYSVYKKALDARGIPAMKLSVADSMDQSGAELAMEAFADIL